MAITFEYNSGWEKSKNVTNNFKINDSDVTGYEYEYSYKVGGVTNISDDGEFDYSLEKTININLTSNATLTAKIKRVDRIVTKVLTINEIDN